jgi:hypothetical protein
MLICLNTSLIRFDFSLMLDWLNAMAVLGVVLGLQLTDPTEIRKLGPVHPYWSSW